MFDIIVKGIEREEQLNIAKASEKFTKVLEKYFWIRLQQAILCEQNPNRSRKQHKDDAKVKDFLLNTLNVDPDWYVLDITPQSLWTSDMELIDQYKNNLIDEDELRYKLKTSAFKYCFQNGIPDYTNFSRTYHGIMAKKFESMKKYDLGKLICNHLNVVPLPHGHLYQFSNFPEEMVANDDDAFCRFLKGEISKEELKNTLFKSIDMTLLEMADSPNENVQGFVHYMRRYLNFIK